MLIGELLCSLVEAHLLKPPKNLNPATLSGPFHPTNPTTPTTLTTLTTPTAGLMAP